MLISSNDNGGFGAFSQSTKFKTDQVKKYQFSGYIKYEDM